MTNADKYLKDGKVTEELIGEMETSLCVPYCEVANFWNKQIKPTLTEDERVILRNLDEKWTYIYRDRWGIICLVDFKLDKEEIKNGDYGIEFEAYNHLFQFIKERRRI